MSKKIDSKNKTGFFFGAGAETSYGFPTGAHFAFKVLNPEKEISAEAKKNFSDFLKLSQEDIQKIAESMIKNQKDEIIEKIKLKDDESDLFSLLEKNNENFPKFSVLKKAIDKFDEDKKTEIECLIKFNVALALFLCGDEIKDNINENIKNSFSNGNWINKDRDFFQLNKNFILDFSNEVFREQEKTEKYEKEFKDLKDLTDEILNTCIDYQLLFEKFDSAFYPLRNKTQFRKIISLLYVMREVIIQAEKNSKKTESLNSYYEDVKNHFSSLEDENFVVCTTNYSKQTDSVFGEKNVYHLNGDIESFFDLENKCIRKIKSDENKDKKGYIPFIFPQVALKPIMYFDVIKLYSDAFCAIKGCSKIAIVGFGLNKDDNLLNGMFKVLLKENPELKIFYFEYNDKNNKEKDYKKILKLDSEEEKRFQVLPLDKDRNSNGKNWLNVFLQN